MPDHDSELEERVLDSIMGEKFKPCKACHGEGKVKVVRTLLDPEGENEPAESASDRVADYLIGAAIGAFLAVLVQTACVAFFGR
jgi:hypothetical protein